MTVFILLLKAGAATAALRLVATPPRVAVAAALALSQVGEFSFVFGRSGVEAGLVSASDWQTLLAASIATMVVTPVMIGAAPGISRRLTGDRGAALDPDAIPQLSGHVVVLGFGIGGQLVGRALTEFGVRYLVLELNGSAVRAAREKGEPIFFGDATSPDALSAAGVERARAVVLVLSDPDASMLAVRTARTLAPDVPIIVRARYRKEADRLVEMGATMAVAEEFEASLEVLTQLLSRLQVPDNAVDVLLERFRRPTPGSRPIGACSPARRAVGGSGRASDRHLRGDGRSVGRRPHARGPGSPSADRRADHRRPARRPEPAVTAAGNAHRTGRSSLSDGVGRRHHAGAPADFKQRPRVAAVSHPAPRTPDRVRC